MFTRVKTADEISRMRVAGRMLATVLGQLKQEISAGMTTKDLAIIAKKELQKLGGQPTFLGYPGPTDFPDVICTSVNDEVVHGIPSDTKIIQEGDIVSTDFGVTYEGVITDSAITMMVGKTTDEVTRLVRATEEAMYAGIASLKDGVTTGDIAAAVQAVLEKHGFGIVRDLVGHGVGHELHEEPNIPNFGKQGSGPKLQAGMTIAIEPMATLGTHEVTIDRDGWTVRTADRSKSAHFEHTILITQNGSEILTKT
jgi:methionyl aminopeptidase